MEIANKFALITGASGSLGQALALTLAEQGWSLILHYSHGEGRIQTLLNTLTQAYSRQEFSTWQADFSKLSTLESSCQTALTKLTKLNLLVNNAALDSYCQIDDLTVTEIQNVLNVNIAAPMLIAKACLPKLKQATSLKQTAQIINISSIWGNYGASMEVLYSASKGAINSLTKALAKELYSFPIKVNAVAPGMFTSSMNAIFTDNEQSDFVNEHSLLQRQGTAKEIASVIAFLASDQASYVNGQILEVSGSYL